MSATPDNLASLPGKSPFTSEVFFQFDNEEPVKLDEFKGYFQIRLREGGRLMFTGEGGKIFKIYATKKQ